MTGITTENIEIGVFRGGYRAELSLLSVYAALSIGSIWILSLAASPITLIIT